MRTVLEIISCNHILYRGDKGLQKRPRSKGRPIKSWENPILEGKEYLGLHRSGDFSTYETIAKEFGVTRARICQMIALAKRLPNEIIDVFSDRKHAGKLQHITGKIRDILII